MTVVPVGSALADIELVQVALAAVDAVEAEAGNPIHVGGQQDAVPVDRRRVAVDRAGGKVIPGPELHPRAFAPAQDRCRHRAVDGDGGPRLARVVDQGLAYGQVELRARQDFELARGAERPALLRPKSQAQHCATRCQSLNELPSRQQQLLGGVRA